MTRLHTTFSCEGATLAGTLDTGPLATGLLMVSGGNEIRSGSWSGQAQLAARVASAGFPVFRYDRRGVGDSEGTNGDFRRSEPDIRAALAAFRVAAPQLERVVAFGSCDAATALMMFGPSLPVDDLVLANPWTIDGEKAPDAMPASAIRSRYLRKLANPREIWRLLTGRVDMGQLARGLKGAAAGAPVASPMVGRMIAGTDAFAGPVSILLAANDRTAQMFEEVWPARDPRVERIQSASHSFSDDEARSWLLDRVLRALR
ncbi:hydrolase 1, exosortase A system-associated [Novosphingobium sp. ZN18A2]|uniref:hydrolase 1, exosortase A system-associated n=1 Tax=Novosphingobium sp. ZN18A2 TaxID=3079861 RepID=UPI0030CDB959